MLKHGKYGTPEYNSWLSAKQRCNDPNHPQYKVSGGCGIKICDRWRDFELFYEDMGERPSKHFLSRKNFNKDYCKSNCFWSKKKRSKPPENLESKCYGLWVAKRMLRINDKIYWKIECSNCGCERQKRTGDFKKAMACQVCQGKPKGWAGMRRLLKTYKGNAESRGIKWELSDEQFIWFTNKACDYCEVKPSNLVKAAHGRSTAWGSYIYNGIDRYDNKLHYFFENCKSCCEYCNSYKKDQTPDEWEQCRKRFALKYLRDINGQIL